MTRMRKNDGPAAISCAGGDFPDRSGADCRGPKGRCIVASGLGRLGCRRIEPNSMTWSFVVAALVAAFAVVPASAEETCHAFESQFAKERMCVSSVLAPQGGSTYGPDRLLGTTDGAWCEGVAGPGVGQSVTLHHDPPQLVRTINVTAGYAKSDDAFRNNGRVKKALIETDRGLKQTVTLKDVRASQSIVIPKGRIASVRLTILEVFPGARGSDTCMSEFLTNLEEFRND
jgi:hypothetical protein